MAQSKQDKQLEHILVTIARDYRLPLVPPNWQQPGDLRIPAHVMAERMLNYAVMIAIADRQGHDAHALKNALNEFARLQGQLYEYVVVKLYTSQSGKRLDVDYYEADDFLVLVLTAGVAPVLEAMAQIVTPFVMQHHRQPTPGYRDLRQLVDKVLATLYADPEPQLRDGIIERIEPLLIMSLRLLPMMPPAPPKSGPDSTPTEIPAPEPQVRESLSPDQLLDEEFAPDTGDYPAEQETPPAQQAADETAPRRRHTLRAPIPYWDIKDGKK
jgi:hypothetical protein